jgi:hypothetical protein
LREAVASSQQPRYLDFGTGGTPAGAVHLAYDGSDAYGSGDTRSRTAVPIHEEHASVDTASAIYESDRSF